MQTYRYNVTANHPDFVEESFDVVSRDDVYRVLVRDYGVRATYTERDDGSWRIAVDWSDLVLTVTPV